MSLIRRWFDPIRSTWFYQRPQRQEQLSSENGISIYLRLDDVYSYLAVQQLEQLEDILVENIKPLKIIISEQSAPPPQGMSLQAWQRYGLSDAKILAIQHRFAYDEQHPELPRPEAVQQAHLILERTPLQGQAFLYLLEDVFHMLWNQQYGKLNMLYRMAKQHQTPPPDAELRFSAEPILTAYFEFGGRQYHAVDDLLRFTRRLQQQKLLTEKPIFLVNHIEWREHLLSDAEEINDIQALQPELDVYLALEDPMSWLLLAYLNEELVDLYNIRLNVYPLNYQQKDHFDWRLVCRLSKRMNVAFTPFCRPDENTVQRLAAQLLAVEEDRRAEFLLAALKQTWCKGKDLSDTTVLQALLTEFALAEPAEYNADVQQQLTQYQQQCQQLGQPYLPVMVLRVDKQQFVFSSLYRVWMVESIFSSVLGRIYRER